LTGQPTIPKFPSPDTYTPKHLAEKILISRSALEGERKQVTVLFADLKSSMELLAERDPEDARRLLDAVLEHMMEAVHHYEGTVNQVMGDGIMALFGAPLAHEDHAVRACYAALRMQENVKQYAEDMFRSQGVPIQIRIGLNSGDVIVRAIGNDLRMDYTAVGQTTHLAARMEQLATPGTIRLTAETLRLAEWCIEVKRIGPIPVKGLPAPVDLYDLVGASGSRSRLHASAAKGLTQFVGRDPQIDQLRQALEGVGAGHGQVVAVVGEPGVGKSRLFWEFTHSHYTQGCLVLEGASVSYGQATAYVPVVGLLKTYFQIETRDGSRRIRERVTGRLLSLDRRLEPWLPALLSLLDVPTEDTQWERLEPTQRRQRIQDGVRRLLLRESQVQPLLVLFEDLHWIDGETQALLDSLVESLPMARLLLLVSYRPEYQHSWGSKAHYRQLWVDPLPVESANDLLGNLLGADASCLPLKRALIVRTEGNPLFLEESVRALVETRVLTGARGAYRLAQDVRTIQVPATVHSILAARIDRLSPDDKRLLQAASVVGKDIPFTLLQAVAELPDEVLRHGLARLQAAEFLFETRLFPDVAYTFKHALTHEVAYSSVLHDRRRALHRRILGSIQQLRAEQDTEQVELLAHHALKAEDWEPAVRYLRQAGKRAGSRSAHREAVSYLQQALDTLQQLPTSREMMEEAIDIRFDLRNSLHSLGDFERMLDHLSEAKRLAETLADQRRLGRVFSLASQYFRIMGDPHRAIVSGHGAIRIAEQLEDTPLWIVANIHVGQAYAGLGDYQKAIEVLTKTIMSLRALPIHQDFGLAGLPSVFSRIYLVCCLAERGEFSEGIAYGEEGIRLAEEANHLYSLTYACFGVGTLFLVKGEIQRAIPLLERGLELCRTLNLLIGFPLLASALGSAYALSARLGDAIPLLEEAVNQAASMKRMGEHSMLVTQLAQAYLLGGRQEEAARSAQHALRLSREHSERGREAYALRLLGEIASYGDTPDVEAAEDLYRQASALAEELGMRPLRAQCDLGLGALFRRVGQRGTAEERLAAAIESFRAQDMQLWLEQARAELQALA
jgi:class 3 adenylate cyclase/tetratricopeptide (TPR) repeat protein